MSDCAGCDHPEKYGHNAYCPESRIDELKVRLANSERLREDERLTWDAQHKRQASMNAHLAALVTDAQEELRKCQQDAIEIQADNERLRGLLREVRMPPCVDDPVVWAGVSADWFQRRDAALGTQADQPPAVASACHWVQGGETSEWQTDCGMSWWFDDEGPTENGAKFCCGCGKPLVAVSHVDPPTCDECGEELEDGKCPDCTPDKSNEPTSPA